MPISEDEFEFRANPEPTNMSKAELRKTHKPIMEKRRRARINHCLNEIKSLILEAMNKDPARHSKLEKADILEMAVKHLQNVQRQQLALAMATDPSVLRKFKTGFNECANEIDRYVNQMDGVDQSLKERMKSHLHKCINGIEQVAHFNFPGFSNLPFLSTNSFNNQNTVSESGTGDQNNNARIQIPQGIHLIPSRLPSGELALLVPNSGNLPYFPPLSQNQRPSAFVTVVPSTETRQSPPGSPKSPRGFRPVQPLKFQSPEQQVPQISSTQEVKNMRFPIFPEKKGMSPRKIVEPLCIITNQNERYKQAQTREDSVDFEENRLEFKRKIGEDPGNFDGQNLKRKIGEGLLTVASQEFAYPNPKVIKVEPQRPVVELRNDRQAPSGSRDEDNETNSDMWRPW